MSQYGNVGIQYLSVLIWQFHNSVFQCPYNKIHCHNSVFECPLSQYSNVKIQYSNVPCPNIAMSQSSIKVSFVSIQQYHNPVFQYPSFQYGNVTIQYSCVLCHNMVMSYPVFQCPFFQYDNVTFQYASFLCSNIAISQTSILGYWQCHNLLTTSWFW